MAEPVVTLVEQSNLLAAAFDKKDQELNEILSSIDSYTQVLLDAEVSNSLKYEKVMSTEYLMVRARILIETESINIKRILSSNNSDITSTLKSMFLKRDQYLAQVSLKLNSISAEVSNLQKVVYCGSNFIKK